MADITTETSGWRVDFVIEQAVTLERIIDMTAYSTLCKLPWRASSPQETTNRPQLPCLPPRKGPITYTL